MAQWTDMDTDFDDDGSTPWALGDDDEAEPFERWDEEDDGADDPWLDHELDQLRHAADDTDEEAASYGQPVDSRAGLIGEPSGDAPSGPVLRRPAPRRSRHRRANTDDAADLPAPHTPGYRRDRRGTWRYAANGRAVPGARDLTLRWLYRFPTQRGSILVPVDQVRNEAELAWCLAWKHTLTTRIIDGHSVTVIAVPGGEWERRADIPIGLWAPELAASRLLAIADVARIAGVSPATITAYLARRRMPPPVTRIGNSPVWTRPVVDHWLTTRPGQGVRPRGAPPGRR